LAPAARADLEPIVEQLDELIRAIVPDLAFAVKWKRAYYGLPELVGSLR
jgi:hypothetical protein